MRRERESLSRKVKGSGVGWDCVKAGDVRSWGPTYTIIGIRLPPGMATISYGWLHGWSDVGKCS